MAMVECFLLLTRK